MHNYFKPFVLKLSRFYRLLFLSSTDEQDAIFDEQQHYKELLRIGKSFTDLVWGIEVYYDFSGGTEISILIFIVYDLPDKMNLIKRANRHAPLTKDEIIVKKINRVLQKSIFLI